MSKVFRLLVIFVSCIVKTKVECVT